MSHRRAQGRIGLATVTLLLGAGLAASIPASRAGADVDALAALNERWAGASCRIRFDVPIKKGRDSQGWSKSIGIVPRTEGYTGLSGALFSVSDRDLTLTRIPSFTTPQGFRVSAKLGVARGTSFIAEGWGFEKPKKRSGLALELRFADLPARARMSFVGKFGGKAARTALEQAERWARIELFQLEARDELLVEAPAAARAPPPSPAQVPRAPEASTTAPELTPGSLAVRVLGVAVEPLTVAPGGEVEFVVTYAVEGLSPGNTVEVTERRTILSGGEILTTLEARQLRGSGTHRSSQTLGVPATLAAGVLTFRGSIHAGSTEASAETLFQVAPR